MDTHVPNHNNVTRRTYIKPLKKFSCSGTFGIIEAFGQFQYGFFFIILPYDPTDVILEKMPKS